MKGAPVGMPMVVGGKGAPVDMPMVAGGVQSPHDGGQSLAMNGPYVSSEQYPKSVHCAQYRDRSAHVVGELADPAVGRVGMGVGGVAEMVERGATCTIGCEGDRDAGSREGTVAPPSVASSIDRLQTPQLSSQSRRKLLCAQYPR